MTETFSFPTHQYVLRVSTGLHLLLSFWMFATMLNFYQRRELAYRELLTVSYTRVPQRALKPHQGTRLLVWVGI
jgi:hypothetical protein